jgi:acetyl esterase/lipase
VGGSADTPPERDILMIPRRTVAWIVVMLVTAVALAPAGIGASGEGTTAYAIHAATVTYGDAPFLITDLRAEARYEAMESYEMRTVTVYRAHDGQRFLTGQPVVFFVHGGGWTDEYAAWYDFVADSFTGEMGWVTVVVDYRLTSDQVFLADEHCPTREICEQPEHVAERTKAAWYADNLQDVAAAFEWTVANIAEYGGNPGELFLFGHSAGGHLVSLLATHPDYAETLRPDMRAIISMSGAYLVKELDPFTFGSAIDQTFTGGHIDNDAQLDEASPATYVKVGMDLPPFYLLHSQTELPSLYEQKLAFRSRLQSFGLTEYHDYLVGYTHVTEMEAIADIDETPTRLIVEFIEMILDMDERQVYLPVLAS